jgi:hypothetical protein
VTLFGRGEDWEFGVRGRAKSAWARGTVALSACTGCPVSGTATVEVEATATGNFHYTDRRTEGGPPGTEFYIVNGWDNNAAGQLSIDGVAVESGMTGWIQDAQGLEVYVRP